MREYSRIKSPYGDGEYQTGKCTLAMMLASILLGLSESQLNRLDKKALLGDFDDELDFIQISEQDAKKIDAAFKFLKPKRQDEFGRGVYSLMADVSVFLEVGKNKTPHKMPRYVGK